jgi:hypothetical protein
MLHPVTHGQEVDQIYNEIGICTGLGVAPNKIETTIGIAKAYLTRVGEVYTIITLNWVFKVHLNYSMFCLYRTIIFQVLCLNLLNKIAHLK